VKKLPLMFLLIALICGGSIFADSIFSITVRGINSAYIFLAWERTYSITALTLAEAEFKALERARNEGCEKTSAYIFKETVTIMPEQSRPTPPPQPAPTPVNQGPHINYDIAYRAGYDHGITGFLTAMNPNLSSRNVPPMYEKAGFSQAYQNGYARGFADEKQKAELKASTEKKTSPSRQHEPRPPQQHQSPPQARPAPGKNTNGNTGERGGPINGNIGGIDNDRNIYR
jgi:hypothetical protein